MLLQKQSPDVLLGDRTHRGCPLDKLVLVNRAQGRGSGSWETRGSGSLISGSAAPLSPSSLGSQRFAAAKVSSGSRFLSDRKSLPSPKLQAVAQPPGRTEKGLFFPEGRVSRSGRGHGSAVWSWRGRPEYPGKRVGESRVAGQGRGQRPAGKARRGCRGARRACGSQRAVPVQARAHVGYLGGPRSSGAGSRELSLVSSENQEAWEPIASLHVYV